MSEYFVKTQTITGGSAPDNGNDGLDPIGFNLSTADYDDTGHGEGNYHLSETGVFTTYSHTAGDTIYLSGGAGITPGLYTIASKVDNDALLLTSSAGTDSTGDVTSSDGAWLTIQFAADTAAANGDIVDVCADANHAPSAKVDFDTNAYSNTDPAIFRGASARGVPGTLATIIGTSLPGDTDLIDLNVDSLAIIFYQIRFTGGTNYNINLNNGLQDCLILFDRCRIDDATDSGFYNQESSTGHIVKFILSEIDNNGNHGIESVGTQRGGYHFNGCEVHDNTNDGVQDTSGDSASKCVYTKTNFYGNGGNGLNFVAVSNTPEIDHCIFFANDGDGIRCTNTVVGLSMTGNIFRSNGGYAVNLVSGSIGQILYADYNCYSNNTSGIVSTGTMPGTHNIIDNPDFTSETDGSEDFALQAGSPCLDAALNPLGY